MIHAVCFIIFLSLIFNHVIFAYLHVWVESNLSTCYFFRGKDDEYDSLVMHAVCCHHFLNFNIKYFYFTKISVNDIETITDDQDA